MGSNRRRKGSTPAKWHSATPNPSLVKCTPRTLMAIFGIIAPITASGDATKPASVAKTRREKKLMRSRPLSPKSESRMWVRSLNDTWLHLPDIGRFSSGDSQRFPSSTCLCLLFNSHSACGRVDEVYINPSNRAHHYLLQQDSLSIYKCQKCLESNDELHPSSDKKSDTKAQQLEMKILGQENLCSNQAWNSHPQQAMQVLTVRLLLLCIKQEQLDQVYHQQGPQLQYSFLISINNRASYLEFEFE